MTKLCERCGKYPKYQRQGKVYKLCAACGWEALKELLGWPDEPAEQVNEAGEDQNKCLPLSP